MMKLQERAELHSLRAEVRKRGEDMKNNMQDLMVVGDIFHWERDRVGHVTIRQNEYGEV